MRREIGQLGWLGLGRKLFWSWWVWVAVALAVASTATAIATQIHQDQKSLRPSPSQPNCPFSRRMQPTG